MGSEMGSDPDTPRNRYDPDSPSPPAETIRETLGDNWRVLYRHPELKGGRAKALLRGELSINWTIAKILEEETNVPASFWLRRQSLYDNHAGEEV